MSLCIRSLIATYHTVYDRHSIFAFNPANVKSSLDYAALGTDVLQACSLLQFFAVKDEQHLKSVNLDISFGLQYAFIGQGCNCC